jgi:hypothetical protein
VVQPKPKLNLFGHNDSGIAEPGRPCARFLRNGNKPLVEDEEGNLIRQGEAPSNLRKNQNSKLQRGHRKSPLPR